MRNCPKCDAILEHQQAEPDVGIEGCWICTVCDEVFEEDEDEQD